MPSIDKVSKLFQALAHDDVKAAKELATKIASREDEKGHHSAARLLRGSLSNGVHTAGSPTSFLDSALSLRQSPVRLDQVSLPTAMHQQVMETVNEFRLRSRLAERQIRRRTKLLFHGPPGCGKSLCAHALANEVGLPLYVVRFDSVIGAYLGQTALNLRQLFHFAETKQCVLLFDEIDALGKRRGSSTDVGELDRIVIALMQELELSEVQGFLIATSNLPETLDLALWRRFDLSLAFPTPPKRDLWKFASAKAQSFGIVIRADLREKIGRLKNYADVEREIEDEARRQLLRSL